MPVAFVSEQSRHSNNPVTNGEDQLSFNPGGVPTGNLLAAFITYDADHSTTAISKPAGESAGWSKIAQATADNAGGRGEWWVIRTTITWASPTITISNSAAGGVRSGAAVFQFSGVESVVRGTVGVGPSNQSISTATATGLLNGDLALAGTVEAGVVISTDPEPTVTSGGGWSTQYDARSADSAGRYAVWGSAQYKILTANGNESYSASVASSGGDVGAVILGLKAANDAPNAPTLVSPASGQTINRNTSQRLRWLFSDPNPNDTQSAADVRYRQTGTATWTTISSGTPTQSYDFAGGTFAAAHYEWQARTYDALGEVGPWSSSGFFTAVDAPAGPTITAPANGASVDAQQVVSWSTAQQDAYRLRKVADNAGAAVTGTVYYDTGVVEESTTRDLLVSFPTNDRAEHIQVQVRYQGVWSPWSDVLVDVSYTPPPTPVVVLSTDPATGSLLVGITNPDPASGDPAAVYSEVWINDGQGEERRATGVPLNGAWRYWTPISGRDYNNNIRVVAVAANGTTASS